MCYVKEFFYCGFNQNVNDFPFEGYEHFPTKYYSPNPDAPALSLELRITIGSITCQVCIIWHDCFNLGPVLFCVNISTFWKHDVMSNTFVSWAAKL